MTTSSYTKKARAELWTLRIIDLLILVGPIIVYFFMGICAEGVIYEKLALTGTMAIAVILVIFNLITKKHLRSPLWIALIGIYVAVANIIPLLITLAITTILDEFVLSPMIANKKTALISNKTIDARM